MPSFASLLEFYHRLGNQSMTVGSWHLFTKALTLAFLAYWVHLHQGLDDWLGIGGFHPATATSLVFAPLPSPAAHFLWWMTLFGGFLLLIPKWEATGCILAGGGFFYATQCDPFSAGALNMHFLFALLVIFWSTSLPVSSQCTVSAWPTYLIRLYLVVVYFGSGWRKAIFGDWLANPNALRHCITGYFTTDLTRWLNPLLPSFSWTIIQYLTLGFELSTPLILLYQPFRKFGAVLGVLVHIGIALLMKDLVYFSLQMLTFYIPILIPTTHLVTAPRESAHQSAI